MFSATGDDGIRVLVDGALIVDGWFCQSPPTYTADIPLSEGQDTVSSGTSSSRAARSPDRARRSCRRGVRRFASREPFIAWCGNAVSQASRVGWSPRVGQDFRISLPSGRGHERPVHFRARTGAPRPRLHSGSSARPPSRATARDEPCSEGLVQRGCANGGTSRRTRAGAADRPRDDGIPRCRRVRQARDNPRPHRPACHGGGIRHPDRACTRTCE